VSTSASAVQTTERSSEIATDDCFGFQGWATARTEVLTRCGFEKIHEMELCIVTQRAIRLVQSLPTRQKGTSVLGSQLTARPLP
jgi:hypothetical protein